MLSRISSKNILIALCIAFTVIGCSNDETSSPTGTDNSAITAPYYAQATIDGKVVTLQANPATSTLNSIVMGTTGGGRTEAQGEYYAHEGSEFKKIKLTDDGLEDDITVPRITIEFGKMFTEEPYKEEVEVVVYKGAMPYGGMYIKKDGVEISYRDTQGKEWRSSFGSADQTGSSFEVTDHIRGSSGVATDKSHFHTKATFNCNLYDETGQSMTLTNGKLSGRTVAY